MQVIKLFIAMLMIVVGAQAAAQVQQARGQYVLNYKEYIGAFDKKEVPAKAKAKAQQEAALKAVEHYYAEAGQSEAANFDAIREKILHDQGRYILESTVIAEEDNTKEFKYSVVVRVSLNVANLRNAVQANSAVGRASEAEKSMLSFVFVSRQVSSEKTFDDRVYKRAEGAIQASGNVTRQEKNSLKEATSEGESVKNGRIDTRGSRSQQTDESVKVDASRSYVATSETGGSTTRKASESTWRLLPSANLNQVFVASFSQAGYDVVEAAMVESEKFKVAQIEDDYKSGNDLQPKTLRSIAAGMREAAIPFVALGTLDVGLPARDPQTGLTRVDVTVNAKVWDVSKTIPRTKAAVGPVTYSGVGPTEDVARGNALKAAASSATQELSSRMTTIGIR
ncbi:MAG: hypothetical protein K2W93_07305 [Burkholderiaceae bacterium]|nr:hypothetical protein [Burkholderiaceae bacterium]